MIETRLDEQGITDAREERSTSLSYLLNNRQNDTME